jgi:acetyl esterase/lipase
MAQPRKRGRLTYPPELPGATAEVYKSIDDVKLNMYIFTPTDFKATDERAAIVFFFGGGWKSGSPAQFYHQCKHLASRGMVAMATDYRVLSRHQTKAVKSVEDAKSAIRWVRKNSKRLGVDPARIVAAGGSAGGHLAACTALISKFDIETGRDEPSSQPSSLVLFNPALVLAPVDGKVPLDPKRVGSLRERMGVDTRELSPYHHIEGLLRQPMPTIIFHGTADATVAFRTAELFAQAMKKAGKRCELMASEGEGHGFFNYGRKRNAAYEKTVKQMDAFLVSMGYIEKAANRTAQ